MITASKVCLPDPDCSLLADLKTFKTDWKNDVISIFYYAAYSYKWSASVSLPHEKSSATAPFYSAIISTHF